MADNSDTPSPTKRSHQLPPPAETPHMPRLISSFLPQLHNATNDPHGPSGPNCQVVTGNGNGLEGMAMIADASFDFGDSTTSHSHFNSTSSPIGVSRIPTSAFVGTPNNLTQAHPAPMMKSKEQMELETENEILKSAIRSLEVAASRIKMERDTARDSELSLQQAIKDQRWEVVRRAIRDEIDRSREYREDLAKWKLALGFGPGK